MTRTCTTSDAADTLLRVKAVPGAKRPGIAGVLGDRLKVKVSAPPEGGKANTAIRTLIARALNIAPSRITLERGQSDPAKTLRIGGLDERSVREGLGL